MFNNIRTQGFLMSQFNMCRMFSAQYTLNYKGKQDLQNSSGQLLDFTANNLWDNPGARRYKKQLGRGPGSGKG